jgi:hypothetical protein
MSSGAGYDLSGTRGYELSDAGYDLVGTGGYELSGVEGLPWRHVCWFCDVSRSNKWPRGGSDMRSV